MDVFADIYGSSINKYDEELCGDKFEYFRTSGGLIAVLSDGLGSGVKANILSTLTSKIAVTMLKGGAEIKDVVDTIANTLPVCSIRKLAYSTFSILQINSFGEAYLAEFDTPSLFKMENDGVKTVNYTETIINGRIIKEAKFTLLPDESIIMVSDGVIHAGAERTLNLGWQWNHVADFLHSIDRKESAKSITRTLLGACNDLYAGLPGDDTTVVTIKMSKPLRALLFSGPPENKENDAVVVNRLINGRHKKIVCGGTAANIVSRETKKKIDAGFEIHDMRVPPTAHIEGIDLVTEGVLTIKVCLEKLKSVLYNNDELSIYHKDGASILSKVLLEECSHLTLLVGKAINPAHQNPYFPQELSIKLNVLIELKKTLEKLGKVVNIEYY